jgi:hypothetical protein
LSFVQAVPDKFSGTTTLGLNIEHPIADPLIMGSDHKFHFHVFNSSSGLPIKADKKTINCSFHLYNSLGSHIFKANDIVSSDDIYDYEQVILAGNFSFPGQYSYVFQCNSSSAGGYYTNYFEVTPTGLVGTLGFYIIILILSIFIIILGYAYEDEWVIILGAFGFVLLGLFILIYGINGFRDEVYTYAFGLITIMLGSYFAIKAALSKMDSGLE